MSQQEIKNALQQAVKLHQMGLFNEAATLYRQVLQKVPANFDATRLLGVAKMQGGANEEAISLLEKAQSMQPRSAEVLGHLGLAYKNSGQLEKAETAYKSALKQRPDDLNTLLNLGNLHMSQNKPLLAVPLFQRAAGINPTSPQCHTMLADALADMGEYEPSREAYGQALKLAPSDSNALNGLGLSYTKMGALHKAVETFETALDFRANDAHAHNNLGQVFQRQHRYENAVEHFEKAIMLIPDLAPAHNNLGGALFETRGREAAMEAYDRALALAPNFTAAWMNRAIALYQMDALEPALESLRSAQEGAESNELAKAYEEILRHQAESSRDLPSPESAENENAKSILDSYQYMATHAPKAISLSRQRDIHQLAMDATLPEGLVLEFGVFYGHSIRFLAGLTEGPVHGFDSFEGIPEAWFKGEGAGAYSTAGNLPPVPQNVELHAGWFDDTLPVFTKTHPAPVRLANIDCDIYSSTRCIFEQLKSQIVPGTILVFDEYICYPGWREHEYKAFQEFIESENWHYEYLAYSLFSRQTVVRITEV